MSLTSTVYLQPDLQTMSRTYRRWLHLVRYTYYSCHSWYVILIFGPISLIRVSHDIVGQGVNFQLQFLISIVNYDFPFRFGVSSFNFNSSFQFHLSILVLLLFIFLFFFNSLLAERVDHQPWCRVVESECDVAPWRTSDVVPSMRTSIKSLHTRKEFLKEILYNSIAIIAIQHSNIYFVDTFGDFSHTVEWNSLKFVWQISLYI